MPTGKGIRLPGMAAIAGGLLYTVFYLYAIGDLSMTRQPGWSLSFGAIPLEQAFRARSLFLFEGIGVIQAGRLFWLVSPVNLLIATALGLLLAINIHGALALSANPKACEARAASSAGTVGGAVPALLAGGACCAPTLVLMLGIPGLGAFSAFFTWLLPASAALLLANRFWQRRRGAPRMVRLTGAP